MTATPQTEARAVPASVARVLVATDRSATAERAVAWAASLAEHRGAELVLAQVLAPASDEDEGRLRTAEAALQREAAERAGSRGRAVVVVDDDPAAAIVGVAEDVRADVVVVGSVGMAGRKEFLLGNVPNRVSHRARCTVVIVKTGVDDAPPAASAGAAAGAPSDEELLRRALRIGTTLAAHVRGSRRRRGGAVHSPAADAVLLRELLEDLGPTFAKLGQILSTRPDLLPPEVVAELANLQDRVTPLSEGEVVAAMEAALGVPWEDVFATIEPVPLAAGTIGQVHRATLESGERVVVKVQRPNAEALILQDVALLDRLAAAAATRPAIRDLIDLEAVAGHLSRSLRRELDFREEAANLERMRVALEPFDRLRVPRLYPDFSSARLLVMEEIPGVPIAQAPDGQERRAAARQLLESFYQQIMGEGFFHADPHPGNLLWCDGRVYFLDLGMVGELDDDVRELMLLLVLAFWQDDPAVVAEVLVALGGDDGGDLDLAGLEHDFGAFLAEFRRLSLKDIELGAMLQGLGSIAAAHGIRLPASLTLIGKAFAQAQLATATLDPTLDPFAVAGRFVLRRALGAARRHLDPAAALYDLEKLRFRATRLADSIERIAGARPGGALQVDFRSAAITQTIERATRRLSLALVGSTALAVGALVLGGRGRRRR
jgi:predicted unusual protein kinase regulating ubiquinone biosynthesis (AarF/ABC1/UbiB family)/nucleotide-binding universal stress UspA family protein